MFRDPDAGSVANQTDPKPGGEGQENVRSSHSPSLVGGLQAGFELPRSVWHLMIGCYAVFFASLFLVTAGSSNAIFVIVISVLYSAMYFGTAQILNAIGGQEAPSPLDRGKKLATSTGPMERAAVYGQVLIVPAAVAIFGVAIAMICAFIMP